ncbi:hypothetical protein Ait01nite_040570 [Actinoplanes italicus]|uniref:Uncharacterized protein n=1 Tax=Actinoplanes italicus TaxID=113567 RepID=A0A2T0K209_9ACTN|nr:hypothetical protein [Actinoplanes italicus]PRX16856.1 hypothetical protein CLV67_118187 [Actinoplanes italicus]GIE31012.1 hypothetical protein Ait01nite_040570 [Actinoplanes italicus]
MTRARELKPSIPLAADGIPIRHELELDCVSDRPEHEVAAAREDVLGRQDHLFEPHLMTIDGAGRLTSGAENQGGFRLATLPDGDDPPVWIVWGHDEEVRSALPLSRFLLATLL